MSDQVLIALIVGAVLIVGIIVFVLRDRLSDFSVKAKGVDARAKTHGPGLTVSGNIQNGKGHRIKAEGNNITVTDNLQEGENDEIDLKT